MEWFLKVPKILHVYWGGDIIPYIRFLTIKSFIKHNPDWKVMLWQPEFPSPKTTLLTFELNYDVICDDYTSKISELPIDVTSVNFDKIGFRNDAPENFKSDYLRSFLLCTTGGVWSDMDIIYFNPITNLKVNTPENKNIETFVCISNYGHSNGFLMSAPKSAFFKKILELSKESYNPLAYQSLGPALFNHYFCMIEDINKISPTVNMEMNAVYSKNAVEIHQLLDGSPPSFTDGSIGVHWYAGHPIWSDYIKKTNGGLRNLSDNIIDNVIKNI